MNRAIQMGGLLAALLLAPGVHAAATRGGDDGLSELAAVEAGPESGPAQAPEMSSYLLLGGGLLGLGVSGRRRRPISG